MYIEANYTRRWNGRKPGGGGGGVGGGGSYCTDLSSTNPHWANSNSIRTKARKPLVHQPQCIQQQQQQQLPSALQQHHSIFRSMTESSSLNSPSLRQTLSVHSGMGRESLARELSEDYRSGRSDGNRIMAPDLLNFSSSFQSHDPSDNFSFGYYNTGPGRLPEEIAMRLKERFDHRMLRHWIKSHKHSSYAGLLPDGFTYQTDKYVRYQLLAAFLVNKGQVEAWYPYAPMPSNIQSSPETGGRTRLLELTQRRLRLLQRYYAEARQYVVLYVNSSHSEHYLPMGLASDDRYSKNSDASNKLHKANQAELVKDGHKAVWRFLASMLSNSRITSLRHSTGGSPARPKPSLRHLRCMSCGTLKDSVEHQEKRSKREHSQPKSETDDSKGSSSPPSSGAGQDHLSEAQHQRISFVKRFLENFWLPHGNQDQTKNRSGAKSSVEEDPNGFKTKSAKETLSIGLIDLSSTTDSITSENTTPTQLDEAPNCVMGLEHGLSSGSGKLADGDEDGLDQQDAGTAAGPLSDTDEVWLPKISA